MEFFEKYYADFYFNLCIARSEWQLDANFRPDGAEQAGAAAAGSHQRWTTDEQIRRPTTAQPHCEQQ